MLLEYIFWRQRQSADIITQSLEILAHTDTECLTMNTHGSELSWVSSATSARACWRVTFPILIGTMLGCAKRCDFLEWPPPSLSEHKHITAPSSSHDDFELFTRNLCGSLLSFLHIPHSHLLSQLCLYQLLNHNSLCICQALSNSSWFAHCTQSYHNSIAAILLCHCQ